MARKKKVEAAAVNITIHPHPPGVYRQFIRDAFALRRAVRVRGDTYMILGSLEAETDAESDLVFGTLIKFTQIDTDSPWFNLDTFAEAEEDQVASVHIPDNLRPNMVAMYFAFYVPRHLLLFEHYSEGRILSARQVTIFLSRLVQDMRLRERFGSIDVSPVADKEGLEEVLNIYSFRSLIMTIVRPNPDTLAGLSAEFYERLEKQNAKQLQEKYDAMPGKALQPDGQTWQVAQVASQNGEVVASGRNEEGINETRSTKDHPAIEGERFDPDVTSSRSAFMTAAKRLIERLF